MPSFEELIRILLPIRPEAEISQEGNGRIVIYSRTTMAKDGKMKGSSEEESAPLVCPPTDLVS